MVINLLAFISSLILSVSNNFIENDLFSVEMSFSLVEETKKKDVYEINFVIVNKVNNPLYYVASYEKSSSYSQSNNSDEDIDSNNDVDSSMPQSDQSAPPPYLPQLIKKVSVYYKLILNQQGPQAVIKLLPMRVS